MNYCTYWMTLVDQNCFKNEGLLETLCMKIKAPVDLDLCVSQLIYNSIIKYVTKKTVYSVVLMKMYRNDLKMRS